jgi:hypothetical protein
VEISTEAEFWGGFREGQEHAEGFGRIHHVGLFITFSVKGMASIRHVRIGFKINESRFQGGNK